jgi:signal transduction histidine kinase
MTGAPPDYEPAAGRSLQPGFRRLPHALLAVAWGIAAVAGSSGGVEGPYLLWSAAVTALASGWTALTFPRWDGGPAGRPVGYFAGRLLFCAVLLWMSPWYGIYAWGAYIEAIWLFPGRRALVAIAVAAPFAAASYIGGYPTSWPLAGLWVLLSAASTALVSFFAIGAQRTEAKDEQREQALAELTEANHRLELALAENRSLAEQVVAQARAAGAVEERTRLAGEIHDTLAQALTGIVRQLEAARRAGEIAGDHRHVDQAAALAADGLAEARRSLHALRPAQLEGARLSDAVADVASRWSERCAVPVTVDVTGDVVPLATESEIALLRVVQEGLANIEKHAGASRVGVTLTYLEDAVLLDVRDDGAGFQVDPAPRTDGTGMGLRAMRERLARVAGELVLETGPGEGTALAARVPLQGEPLGATA